MSGGSIDPMEAVQLPAVIPNETRAVARVSAHLVYRLAVGLILLLAVASRFYGLGERVMSHDEVNHVAPAFDFYQGRGYRYDPITHGPLQFHLIAASYLLFGDSDFSSRIPAALFSVATVALGLLAFRRWLGRAGSLAAGVMLLISPYMLFYGRYARNEALIVVWALLGLWAILRYLESGSERALIVFTLSSALHFCDKATAYIFAAEQGFFLLAYLLYRTAPVLWQPGERRQWWRTVRRERAFDLLMVLGTLILPLLSALPLKLLGFDPLDNSSAGMLRAAAAVGVMGLFGLALGLWWGGRRWLRLAALFYLPFLVLYSSVFSNGAGLAGGFLGSLGYWISQQAVERGEQPLYYYALLQVPLYEFLPALGALMAAWIGVRRGLWQTCAVHPYRRVEGDCPDEERPTPALALFLYWSVTSLLAFTAAGERMPWLTIHIALPLILAASWAVGYLAHGLDWARARRQGVGLVALLLVLALAALGGAAAGLADLRAGTGWYPEVTLGMAVLAMTICAIALAWWLREWSGRQARHYLALLALLALGLLTGRASFRAAFILYDYPFEYLVYAHAAPDPKKVLAQIDDLALKSGSGSDLVIAYDRETRYPFWWYLRRYPKRIDYNETPTRDLRNAQVILVGDNYYPRMEPVVGEAYWQWDYTRLWWPNQDYFSLKWERVAGERAPEDLTLGEYLRGVGERLAPFFTDPAVRDAVWQIWFNRDYSAWAALKGGIGYSAHDWQPSKGMRMYVRKDIAYQAWKIGTDEPLPFPPDPYEGVRVERQAERVLANGFNTPGGLALAPDGSLYVADTGAQRIQHISAEGALLQTWGSFADRAKGEAPGGTFNEPWGVAVGPDGSVYVADTWNHRIQKFGPQGEFLLAWGEFGEGMSPRVLWGPRGIAVDWEGRVYVADTGNKRIVVYDSQGQYLTQFGGVGKLNEPVGVAVEMDPGAGVQARVYVADTWNQRVQVYTLGAGEETFERERGWDVAGWYGQSVDNKPFIGVDGQGNVTVSDPEGPYVIQFDPGGRPARAWGGYSAGTDGFGRPAGLAVDAAGGVWVSDALNNRVLYFGK